MKTNTKSLEETLQAVYDSEINVCIDWCWDGGFDISTGSRVVCVTHANEIAQEVHELVIAEYPRNP